jgi:hypothetical protein
MRLKTERFVCSYLSFDRTPRARSDHPEYWEKSETVRSTAGAHFVDLGGKETDLT